MVPLKSFTNFSCSLLFGSVNVKMLNLIKFAQMIKILSVTNLLVIDVTFLSLDSGK